MAIQFACPGCSQPIEVDDEIAGKSAACPYCQRVVTVPDASTYTPQPFGARPASSTAETDSILSAAAPNAPRPPATTTSYPSPGPPAAPYSSGGLHVGPHPDARLRTTRILGNLALCCAIFSAVLFVGGVSRIVGVINELGISNEGSSIPTTQQWRAMNSTPEAFQSGLMICATLPFSVVGLVLAIVSLRRKAGGDWRGWTALFVCAGPIGLFLLGMFLQLVLGIGPPV